MKQETKEELEELRQATYEVSSLGCLPLGGLGVLLIFIFPQHHQAINISIIAFLICLIGMLVTRILKEYNTSRNKGHGEQQ